MDGDCLTWMATVLNMPLTVLTGEDSYRADHALDGHDVPDEGVLVLRHVYRHLQGYLAHKKTPPPRTLS